MLQNEIKNFLVRYIRKQYNTFATSDELALNLWFGPGTEASVPAVSRYWFLYLGSFLMLDTRASVQGSLGIICIFLFLVLVRFHSSTILISHQLEPKALISEPKLTGT